MVVFKSECPSLYWTCLSVIPASKHRLACVCRKPWILIGRTSESLTICCSHFRGSVPGIGFPNSFSKIKVVVGFISLHSLSSSLVFSSKLINRLLLLFFVGPTDSPSNPLVMALFMLRVLLVQSSHLRAKTSPFRAPVKARRRKRTFFLSSSVWSTNSRKDFSSSLS